MRPMPFRVLLVSVVAWLSCAAVDGTVHHVRPIRAEREIDGASELDRCRAGVDRDAEERRPGDQK